jgi:diaminopimelate epimerase
MHGAGNDFIAIDDWRKTVPWTNTELMTAVATRRTGIGCEGIILVQPPAPEGSADFRMRFLNPDGREAGMCGNGARCAALFAYRHGLAGRLQRIQTGSGFVNAEILDARPFAGAVRLTTSNPAPTVVRSVAAAGAAWTCHCLDTGVPHAVVFVEDVAAVDVRTVGRALRWHADFAPAGVNVDFVQALPDGGLGVRTYERGVEDESGACGTGALASALAAVSVLGLKLPLTLNVSSGDRLVVDVALGPNGETVPTLTGPAREVYTGVIDLAGFGGAKA